MPPRLASITVEPGMASSTRLAVPPLAVTGGWPAIRPFHTTVPRLISTVSGFTESAWPLVTDALPRVIRTLSASVSVLERSGEVPVWTECSAPLPEMNVSAPAPSTVVVPRPWTDAST